MVVRRIESQCGSGSGLRRQEGGEEGREENYSGKWQRRLDGWWTGLPGDGMRTVE